MRSWEKKIGKFIDKAVSSLIAYEDADGGIDPVTQAKLILMERHGIKELWFSTRISFTIVELFRSHHNALIYFYHKSFLKLVYLTGTLEVLEIADAGDLFDCVLKFTAVKATYSTNIKSDEFSVL